MARLAALVLRLRTHVVRYHGLFAPNATHRHHIVTPERSRAKRDNIHEVSDAKPIAPMTWMQRLRRVFALDLQTVGFD